jgi:hypothetical protein
MESRTIMATESTKGHGKINTNKSRYKIKTKD